MRLVGAFVRWFFSPLTNPIRMVGWFVEALGRVYR